MEVYEEGLVIGLDVYDGDFKNDNRHGHGTMTYSDGDVYVGGWLYDYKSGQGNMTFKNGDTYEGDYMNDKPHGRGKYKCAGSCEFYDGQYSDGGRK